jgi:hypothetical protein
LPQLRANAAQTKIDALSHYVRQFSENAPGKAVHINFHDARRWFQDDEIRLEPPAAQARNLIIWLGTLQSKDMNPAAAHNVDVAELASIIGAKNDVNSITYVTNHLRDEGFFDSYSIQINQTDSNFTFRLSFRGWERFDELQRAQADSRLAFMAMQFNIPALEAAFTDCFRPAAQDAGFELRRLTDGQGAGLIDAQLRVRIRTAKFLVADLSTGNKGAYWEAGFAEGLGRPVIYMCEKSVWEHDDKDMRPHFDTNHLNTVVLGA